MAITLVETLPALEDLLAAIDTNGMLYVDLEGQELGRDGTLDLMAVMPASPGKTPKEISQGPIYIVNIHKLGIQAFDHVLEVPLSSANSSSSESTCKSLRGLFEDPDRPIKVFWDVRNDSDALFSHHGVKLSGVIDVQILELLGGSRPRQHRNDRVCGLELAVRMDARLDFKTRDAWVAAKHAGVELFAPEKGGSYDAFRAPELSPAILKYCANDVRFLPQLQSNYSNSLYGGGRQAMLKANKATQDRLEESRSPGYEPRSKAKILSPWASEAFRGKIAAEIREAESLAKTIAAMELKDNEGNK